MLQGIGRTVVACLGIALLSAAAGGVASSDLSEILLEAQRLIEEQRVTEALEVLDEGRDLAASLEQENLVTMELYLWQAAITHLDFASQLTNQEQYREYADRSRQRWEAYIDWYGKLTDQQKKSLPAKNVRIMKATVHLANSLIRMETPREIFTAFYEVPDVRYLSSESFKLWKSWLYACPDMEPVPSAQRDAALRRQKICTEACAEDWRGYAEVLADWADADWDATNIADPNERMLGLRRRESDQIFAVENECGN